MSVCVLFFCPFFLDKAGKIISLVQVNLTYDAKKVILGLLEKQRKIKL